MTTPKYSIVVPVFNRPDELMELLESLTAQTFRDFEVVIVEDGSSRSSEKVVNDYQAKLSITYYVKPNSGPGPSRNFGFERAKGHYFVVFDSDCILPPTYFETIEKFLIENPLDAWGGPDRGHQKFTPLQQAMAYTMSSLFTTGGIRGSKNGMGSFQPRSFNMGLSRQAFEKTGGFLFDRFAEDIELSIRMKKLGLRVGLIVDAFVYHKRRANLKQFFKQVFNFGRGRVQLAKQHAGEIKWVHYFPFIFSLGFVSIPISYFITTWLGVINTLPYAVFICLIFADCWLRIKSPTVALFTIPAAIVQMFGYGLGFFTEMIKSFKS
ncbi:MAG: glycosyltransferase [Cytophagales bacterium]